MATDIDIESLVVGPKPFTAEMPFSREKSNKILMCQHETAKQESGNDFGQICKYVLKPGLLVAEDDPANRITTRLMLEY